MADEENLSLEQTEKLLHFQEITHNDSIEECKRLLEVFQWDVEKAVQNTFENNLPPPPSTPQRQNQSANSLNENQIPNVNSEIQSSIFTDQAVAPQGFFQWTFTLISLPFRFFFRTLLDLATFFLSFFEDESIPENYDPNANVAEFISYFDEKFGTNHPDFLNLSYTQALDLAKRELKFLVVYIHRNEDNQSIKLANENLTNQELISYSRQKEILFWACTKNLPEGLKAYKSIKASRCPALAILLPKRNKMTIVTKIEGPIPASKLIDGLRKLISEQEPELIVARTERDERVQTQQIRQQQDEAFQESLRIDRERERKKQEEKEALQRVEELERQRIQEEEDNHKRKIERKAELKKIYESKSEHDAKDSGAIKIGFKFPDGSRVSRVFLKNEPSGELYKFAFSNDQCPLNFELNLLQPNRRIECSEDSETAIQDVGIDKPIMIYILDQDA
ncbi:FAS-associated factor 2 [Brachionus plicatilis]|uniref:FAS-associated factor 2 n=1 Tax=Brachionus plicatilis TaxID=10195 RepID=A0A3M7PBT9_BRAPC|nr:FAS-associated factor 2 [Brachionus plicatilis]